MRRWRLLGPPGPPLVRAAHFGHAACAAAQEARRRATGCGKLPDALHHSEGHSHAHWVGEDRDGDGRIDHLAVWAQAPLGALDPIEPLARIRLGEGHWRLEETDVRDTPAHLWISATPLIGPNHAWERQGKLKARQDLPSQAIREIARLPDPPRVLELSVTRLGGGAPLYWTKAPVRQRLPHFAVWGWLAVLLAQPRSTPFAAGAFSHWGLGAFRPASEIFHDFR